jgi:hypothetical protein
VAGLDARAAPADNAQGRVAAFGASTVVNMRVAAIREGLSGSDNQRELADFD